MRAFMMEYKKALWLSILLFTFLGMGWDVLMTTVQMILGGFVKRNAVMTASTWMFLVYGAIPLVVFPMEKLLLKLKVPKVLGIFLFLFLFYLAEYAWGFFFHTFEVEPWNYNWYTPKRWNPKSGYISFHPVILFCWLIFVLLGRKLDQVLRIIFT